MNIQYGSKEVARLCTDFGYAQRKLGLPDAKKLFERLQQLDACTVFSDMQYGIPEEKQKTDVLSVRLGQKRRIAMRPLGECVDRETGEIKRNLVTEVIILEIGDYHHGQTNLQKRYS